MGLSQKRQPLLYADSIPFHKRGSANAVILLNLAKKLISYGFNEKQVNGICTGLVPH